MFAELADQFIHDPDLGVSLEPLSMMTRNHHLVSDAHLMEQLRVRRTRWRYLALARYLARPHPAMHADVFHSTFYLTRALGSLSGRPHVVTVHDMIAELFPKLRRRADLVTDKRRYIDGATHIICVSETTKGDLVRIFGDVQAPISVIPHGVNPRFRPTEARILGWPDNYLLYVGRRDGYKDAATLLVAMSHIRSEFPDLKLMLLGGGQLGASERNQISRLGLGDQVIQRNVSDRDMPAAYSGAQAFVFPSRYEGFGLPVLEAMACGTPVVLARAASLPEVGGSAALYFEPGDAIDLATRISGLLQQTEARRSWVDRGRERASNFTWSETARAHSQIYAQISGC